jgi:peptide/nickel transport system substrate-binding protein
MALITLYLNMRIPLLKALALIVLSFPGCAILNPPKQVTQVIYYFPAGLDPAINHEFYEYQIFSQIYEPLLKLGDDYKTLESCLAESWAIGENEKDYIFHLRPGVKFHDDSRLTAGAARYSMLRQIKLRPDFLPFTMIETITAVDDLTLLIKLKYPYSPFLYSLTSPNGLVIMSGQAIEKYGDEIGRHPYGSGPFTLDEWIDDEYISLKKFAGYRSVSHVEKIIFRYPKHISESEVLFKEGNLDILYMVAGFWLDRLRWLGGVEYFVQKPLNTLFIGFNLKSSMMANPLIRRAILLSLDRNKITLISNRGNALVADGPLPPVFDGFSDLRQAAYDPEQAKKLLKIAGHEKNLLLNLYVPSYIFSRKTKIELTKSELEQIGLKIELKYFESVDSYRSAIRTADCHLFFDGYGSELIGDPGNFLYSLFHSRSPYNWGSYHNAKTDQLLEQSQRENDSDKRHSLYREIVGNVLRDMPAVYTAHVKSNFAYNSQKIESIAASPYEFIYYHRLKLRD